MDGIAFDLLLRWAHFIAGIIWVGHNYSSVIQRPSWRALAGADLSDERSPRFQALLNREHGFFRWASVVAWSAGLLMLWRHGRLPGALALQGALAPIGIGAYIGTLMMANVWLVLWPNQQKVLGLKPATSLAGAVAEPAESAGTQAGHHRAAPALLALHSLIVAHQHHAVDSPAVFYGHRCPRRRAGRLTRHRAS